MTNLVRLTQRPVSHYTGRMRIPPPPPNRTPGKRQTAIMPPIRMHREELETLRNAAILAGKTLSEYIRSRLFANDMPECSQLSTSSSLEPTSRALQSLPSVSAPAATDEQFNRASASEEAKVAGRARTNNRPRENSLAKRGLPGQTCPHGFRFFFNGKTACSECKRKSAE